MKIFLIIQDDPFYLFDDIDFIFKKSAIFIVGVTVLGQKLPNDTFLKLIKRYLNVFGWSSFLKLLIKFLFFKYIIGRNIQRKILNNGFHLLNTIDINNIDYIMKIHKLNPDLIVSVACPQKINSSLLKCPNVGVINLHGGYLPDFPGVFTPFWNLLKNSPHAGCTVHWVNDKIDGGNIISRKKILINNSMSMMEIYKLISHEGLQMLVDSIQKISENRQKEIINNYIPTSYNSFPTNKEGKEFRKRGLKAV